MTTTTLRYNGRDFICAPTSLVARDFEGHGNVFAKEPRMELAGPYAGWGFNERTEKLNGRLAMLGFVAATATELITGEGLLVNRQEGMLLQIKPDTPTQHAQFVLVSYYRLSARLGNLYCNSKFSVT